MWGLIILVNFFLIFYNFLKENIVNNTKLADLDISDNAIGNDGGEILGDVINSGQMGYLKKLNISNCKIDFDGIYKIFFSLESNKRLEILICNKNNISSDKFSLIKNFISTSNLRELHIMKCRLGNDASKFLFIIF